MNVEFTPHPPLNGALLPWGEFHSGLLKRSKNYTLSYIGKELEKETLKNIDICLLGLKKDEDILNVFDNSVLGKYMIHFKGVKKNKL